MIFQRGFFPVPNLEFVTAQFAKMGQNLKNAKNVANSNCFISRLCFHNIFGKVAKYLLGDNEKQNEKKKEAKVAAIVAMYSAATATDIFTQKKWQ